MSPGMARTSRPCSRPNRALIRAPPPTAASTTKTTRDKPVIIRFRTGNRQGSGMVPGGYSVTTRNSEFSHPLLGADT